MPLIVKVRSFLRNLFSTHRVEVDLDQEVHSHLEMLVEENIRAGMPPKEAQRAAQIELGGIEQVKEQVREERIGSWFHSVITDCRYGLRQLRRNSGFTAVAVLTLALGIGATSAVFSIVDSVLLRSLPYRDPAHLVWVTDEHPREHMNMMLEPDFFAYQKLTGIFESVSAYESGRTFTLTGAEDATRVDSSAVTYNFFDTLGVRPQLGREFLPEEDRPNAPHVVLLADAFWRQRFAADPAVLGRTIALDGNAYQIVGVLPPQFEFLDNSRADVIVPSALHNYEISEDKPIRLVQVVARLKRGVSPITAAANVDAMNQRSWALYPASWAEMMKGTRATVMPLHEHLVGKVRPALLVLLAAIGFVLLIACVNIANLQLARSVSREREIAIRGALGASRWRLARQLLTENAIIALAGGAFGLLVATWLIQILRTNGPTGANTIPHLATSQLNLSVFLFALVTSLTAGIFFGLAPALATFRVSIMQTIKESGTATGAGLKIRRYHNLFAIAELALALVLFIGAGLLLRSFTRLASVRPGFDPEGVLTARISLPVNLYQTQEKQLAFFREFHTRLSALPGVESVGLANTLPLQGFDLGTIVQRNDRPLAPPGTAPTTPAGVVTPGYFSTLHIPLLKGRLLDFRDTHDAANALVVNEAFVQRYFPTEDALGKELRVGRDEIWTIVGIVADSKQRGLGAAVEPEIFVPVEKWCPPELAFLLRTKGEAESLLPSARAVVASLDKNLPLFGVETGNAILKGEIASQRFNATLLSSFAIFAVLLAAIGIYGVMAYAVHQRVREVGIRIALGARPPDVLWMVLSHGLALASLGLFVGIAGSFALTRLMGSLLYAVRPTDPLTYASASLLLGLIAIAAGYIPAHRAMRVDPVVALRYE